MCYNALQLKRRIYDDAVRNGATEDELKELEEEINRLEEKHEYQNQYHLSGFNHSELLAYDKLDGKLRLRSHTWGLIPTWIKSEYDAHQIWNNTINARGETIFEKPSFKDSAKSKRCVIPLDGFYEFKHHKGKTFPHIIREVDDKPMMVGGLLSKWLNKESGELVDTISLVTTKANPYMAKIHNPPGREARMPLILNDEDVETWLNGNEEDVKKLIRPNNRIELKSHTVRKLSGKSYIGDVEEIMEEYSYPELNEPPTLF